MAGMNKDDDMKLGYLGAACAALVLGSANIAAAQMQNGDHAMQGHAGKIMVESAWARASVSKNGAAYVTLVNRGTTDDRLLQARSDVAARVEIHTTKMEGNIMHMRKVDAIPVPAGRSVTFRPGGYHIMMMGLKHKLKEGDEFPMTLVFEKSGDVAVKVAVKKVGAMGPGMSGGMKMH